MTHSTWFWLYVSAACLFLAFLPFVTGGLTRFVGWPKYSFAACYADWQKFIWGFVDTSLFFWILYILFLPSTLFYVLVITAYCFLSIRPWHR